MDYLCSLSVLIHVPHLLSKFINYYDNLFSELRLQLCKLAILFRTTANSSKATSLTSASTLRNYDAHR